MKRPFLILLSVLAVGCSAPQQDSVPDATPTTPAVPGSCRTIEAKPTNQPALLIPAITEADYSIGPGSALVTIIEYCDFQAPICQSMAAVMGNVLNEHADDVRFIFRPISLGSQLDKSDLALQAAIAAGAQGHFWEMYDVLFVLNDDWGQLQLDEFRGWLRQEAGKMGLDQRRFSSDLLSDGVAREAADRNAAAAALGNLRLPFLVLNGVPQPIFAMDRESIASAVSLIALSRRQYRQCPPLTIDPSKDYFATLHTEKGDIVVHLLAKQAPLSVNSFMFLAREGWFDGVTFHRVLPGFAAQSGDPSGTGQGHPGYFFDDEFSSLKFDRPGVVGMANSGSGTNGSQFFLTFAPAPHLDGSFTIFGEITEGIEVLEQLTPRDPDATPGLPPGDLLLSVEVEER